MKKIILAAVFFSALGSSLGVASAMAQSNAPERTQFDDRSDVCGTWWQRILSGCGGGDGF